MSTDKPKNGWRIHAIELNQFRGVEDTATLQFDGLPALIWGPNGVGKSTIAQFVQWSLFKTFPSGVLQNKSHPSFLGPVGAKTQKVYSGSVTLKRDDDVLRASRHARDNILRIDHAGQTYQSAEAESWLETQLGLDMDTFTRAVLIQQSRMRELLLAMPKERNNVMDRLLGTESVGEFLDVLKIKSLTNAAAEAREELREAELRYKAKMNQLQDHLAEARQSGQELGFRPLDFNPDGLARAYQALSDDLVALGEKYDVTLSPLPECTHPRDADTASKQFRSSTGRLRQESAIHKQLGPIQERLTQISSLQAQWRDRLEQRDLAKSLLAKLEKAYGTAADVDNKRAKQSSELQKLQQNLAATNQLRQLLVQAEEVVSEGAPKECPLCEQKLPNPAALPARLQARIEELASDATQRLEREIAKAVEQLEILEGQLKELEEAKETRTYHEEQLRACLEQVEEVLGLKGLPEQKVADVLKKEQMQLQDKVATLQEGAKLLEESIQTLDDKNSAIREGLLPILELSQKILKLEAAWEQEKKQNKEEAERADDLDLLATRFDRIRQALLSAKSELASIRLNKAQPRAQELYRQLVPHPVFDTLEISTVERANKVDYNFMVSSGGKKQSSREAQLVLSDGQLTATAVGLLFALAESTSHHLDLLYLDDPSQALDYPAKQAVAKVVVELMSHRQVIVSTQDEEFVGSLRSEGLEKLGKIFHFKRWNGNPEIDVEEPG